MPGRLEKKGASITRLLDQETTNRYNENEAVNSLVHELALGIDICFAVWVLCRCVLLLTATLRHSTITRVPALVQR